MNVHFGPRDKLQVCISNLFLYKWYIIYLNSIPMKQIIMIRGGSRYPDIDSFCEALKKRSYNPYEEKKRWKNWIKEKTAKQFETFQPEMPNPDFASYKAWKIQFEKLFPYLNDEGVILIWHSLWWNFLLKYLLENSFPKKVLQLHLVAAVIDGRDRPEHKQYLWDFWFDVDSIWDLEHIVTNIFIYHSTDDKEVPYSHALVIKGYLPNAKLITLTDRWHINQPEFPELLENIVK